MSSESGEPTGLKNNERRRVKRLEWSVSRLSGGFCSRNGTRVGKHVWRSNARKQGSCVLGRSVASAIKDCQALELKYSVFKRGNTHKNIEFY